jgi:hypothetical protein
MVASGTRKARAISEADQAGQDAAPLVVKDLLEDR